MGWGLRGMFRRGRGPPDARSIDDSSRSLGSALRGRSQSRRRSLDGRRGDVRATNRAAGPTFLGVPGTADESSADAENTVVLEGNVRRIAEYAVDDEDGFSTSSTHPSKDPFLNDNSSIPPSIGTDRHARGNPEDDEFNFERRMRQDPFLASVDVVDMDHDLLARARSRNRDRSRNLKRNVSNKSGAQAPRIVERSSSLPRQGSSQLDRPRLSQSISADNTVLDTRARTSSITKKNGVDMLLHTPKSSGAMPSGTAIAPPLRSGFLSHSTANKSIKPERGNSSVDPIVGNVAGRHLFESGVGLGGHGKHTAAERSNARVPFDDQSFKSFPGPPRRTEELQKNRGGGGIVLGGQFPGLNAASRSLDNAESTVPFDFSKFEGAMELPQRTNDIDGTGLTSQLPREAPSSNSSVRCLSGSRRRASLWRLKADSQPSQAMPDYQRQLLQAVALSDTTLQHGNPAAIDKLIHILDSQISEFEGSLVAGRAKVARLRMSVSAMPASRDRAFEEVLYVNSAPNFGTEDVSTANNAAEEEFHEYRTMESVWNIEAAVAEQRWNDAVILLEDVKTDELSPVGYGPIDNLNIREKSSSAPTSSHEHFVSARAELHTLRDRIAAELRVRCSSGTGEDAVESVALLARLGFRDDARRAVYLAGSSALWEDLHDAKRELFADNKYDRYASTVTRRIFAQICESYALLNEIGEVDAQASSGFIAWAVGLIDHSYSEFLAPCVDPERVTIFHIASVVLPMRRSTLCVPSGAMFEEIGMVWDSRLASLVRRDIAGALTKYQTEICGRARVAGSAAIESWVCSPLPSWSPIEAELGQYVRNAALSLVGLDSELDAMIASVITSVCATYTSNVLEVLDEGGRRGSRTLSVAAPQKVDMSVEKDWNGLADMARETMEAVGRSMLQICLLDPALVGDGGISWMTRQLQEGSGMCRAEQLRSVVRSGLPLHGFRGLLVLSSSFVATECEEKRREVPDASVIHETIREVFGRQQRMVGVAR